VLNKLLWICSGVLLLTFASVMWFVLSTPSADSIKGCLKTSLFQVWLCDESTNSNYVAFEDISPYMKNLVLVSEDASFYGHNGFDWDELKNSVELDMSRGRAARGGSTITQQLAKNVFLTNEKTIVRKLREALLTVQIETLLTKNKIFEKYLNVIELGPHIYGIGPAAHYYFNKSAADLNLLEAAYLTFLIPNPKDYSRSFKKSQLTKYGRYRVLDLCFRLMQTKRITQNQYLAARRAVDMFPWQTLPEDLIVGLAGASAPSEIHDAIDESTFDNKATANAANPAVAPDPVSEPPADEPAAPSASDSPTAPPEHLDKYISQPNATETPEEDKSED
jgi:monofunctional glycosyltransferase